MIDIVELRSIEASKTASKSVALACLFDSSAWTLPDLTSFSCLLLRIRSAEVRQDLDHLHMDETDQSRFHILLHPCRIMLR